jgi:hypothetical protein
MLSCGRNNVGDSAIVIHAVKVEPDPPVVQAGNTNHLSNASEPVWRIQAFGLHIRAILKEQDTSASHAQQLPLHRSLDLKPSVR